MFGIPTIWLAYMEATNCKNIAFFYFCHTCIFVCLKFWRKSVLNWHWKNKRWMEFAKECPQFGFFPLHKLSLPRHTHDRGTFSPSVAISRKKRSAFLLLPLLFNIVYFFPKQHHCWPLLRAHSGNSSENFHQNNHCFGPELPSIKISCMLPGRWKKWISVD